MKSTLIFLLIFFSWVLNGQEIYANKAYHFSLIPPKFYPDKENVPELVIAQFFAPMEAGLSPSLSIILQKNYKSLESYIKQSEDNFAEKKVSVLSRNTFTLDKQPAVEWVYKDLPGLNGFKFLAVAVYHQEKIFLMTGTARELNFEKYRELFSKSMRSIKFEWKNFNTIEGVYLNEAHHFIVTPPKFSADERATGNTSIVQFFAPPENKLIPNMNVVFKKMDQEREAYLKMSEEEFAQNNFKIISRQQKIIANCVAIEWELVGTLMEKEVKLLIISIFKSATTVINFQGLSLSSEFELYRKPFLDSIESLRFN